MTTMPVVSVPGGEPEERRSFQMTNLDGNNNKYYNVETWSLPTGDVFFRATYGRVGAAPQVDQKVASRQWVERKIREKTGKGYREVQLHRTASLPVVASAGPMLDPRVDELVRLVHREAGTKIASYLAVGLEGLSSAQIAEGRRLLSTAQQQHVVWQQAPGAAAFQTLAATVQAFYNAVPTQLPARIDREQVVLDFCKQLDEQEDRLNQLEAAIATLAVQQRTPQASLYDALGADIALLPQNDARYGRIADYIARTCVHGYKVTIRDIFTVNIAVEREAFERNRRGTSQVSLLFHGTASQNVWHILRSGLVCPRVPSHGRMFGDGIYFANRCTKSANYCSVSRRGVPHLLFLADVAIGKPFVASDAMSGINAAPRGYDSVWGKAGYTRSWGSKLQFDEHIVYSTAQQSLRYLVTFDR